MNFILRKEDREEVVPLERWAWGVKYHDGSVLTQFDFETGLFHQIGEVDQPYVTEFVMYNTETKQRVKMLVPLGSQIIHKYRHVIKRDGRGQEHRMKMYIFGFKLGRREFFNFILPDDSVIQTENENCPLENLLDY